MKDKIRVGLNFRYFQKKHYNDDVLLQYYSSTKKFLKKYEKNFEFLFFPLCEQSHQNDSNFLKKINKNIKIIDYTNHKDLRNKIDECDLFIGTRYHSCLLSFQQKIPFICISYQNKGLSFMKDVNLENCCIPIEKISFDLLEKKFLELVNNKKLLYKKISILNKQLKNKSLGHYNFLKNV